MSMSFMPPRPLQKPDPMATGSQPTNPLAGSIWANTVPGTPTVKVKSSTLVANLLTQGYGANGNPNAFFVGANDGTPRYVVHGATIAGTYGWTTINVNNSGGGKWWSGPQGIMTAPLPMGWVNSTGSDAQICFWDLDNHTQGSYTGPIFYNYWSFQRNGNTHYPGGCFVEQMFPVNGTYSGFGGWAQDSLTTGTNTASGAPYAATNITYAEWLYGTIQHVLALTIANPTSEYYAPAIASDGNTPLSSHGVPYGTLFYFPSSVSEPNWASTGATAPTLAHQVFVALKNYGMLAVDQTAGNGCDLGVEGYQPWQRWNPSLQFDGVHWPINLSTAYNSFLGMPWSSLQAIVPSAALGSGGGGSSSIGGNTIGNATTTPATITLPSSVAVGDALVMYVTYDGQGWDTSTPTGWTLMTPGNLDKAGTNFACYTKTAAAGDTGGATISLGFSGNGLFWNVVDVKNSSSGATLSQTYIGFSFFGNAPAVLTSGQGLTLLFASVSTNCTPTQWPDGYTQGNWLATSPFSGGFAYFNGPAYGNDAFIPSAYGQSCLGVQVAV